jgi:hypothetical protein
MSLLGPEPALGMPRCSVTEATKNWTDIQHCIGWKYFPGHRHGKLFICRPCKKRADDLLKLSRSSAEYGTCSLTGHAPVKKQLNIMGLFIGNPNCRFCTMGTETVYHVICCCEASVRQRCNFFGNFFAEPKDMSTASLKPL